MSITFELPPIIEQNLRRQLGNLDQAAKVAALIELYRQNNISQHELAESLGVSRLELEAVLKHHNVTEDLPTNDDYEQAAAYLRTNKK